jgi:hypothetical protein
MEALIKAGKKNDEGGYTNPGILSSDMSKLAFLHFLEIEQQTKQEPTIPTLKSKLDSLAKEVAEWVIEK